MADCIEVDELPEFDAASYLDSEAAIAAYLADILAANDAALLGSSLDDIVRARGMNEIANDADYKRALSEIDSLMKAKVGTPEGGRLDTLARKVEVYERQFKL